MKVRRSPRVIVGGLAVAGFLAAAFPSASSVVAQDNDGAFAGTASASAVRTAYSIPNFLIVETFVDGGGPVAQSVYESSGLARAFGSVPYPGDIVTSAPGLVASFGGPSGLPAYPLYASADYPVVPTGSAGDPAGFLTMRANAGSTGSDGSARAVGGVVAGASDAASTASVKRRNDGSVEARAEATVKGLTLSGLVNIGSVHSVSSTVLKPGSTKRVTHQELSFGAASVGPFDVTFGPQGAVLLGQPSPVSVADATKTMNDQLAAAGLSIRVVKGAAVNGGVSSDVLQITSVQSVPIPGGYRQINTLLIGGTTTSVLGGLAAHVESPLVGRAPSAAGAPSSTGESGNGALSRATGTAAVGGLTTGTSAASGGGGEASGVGVGVASARTIRVARDLRPKMRLLYALFVCIGLVGLAGTWVLRRKGVTTSWTL